MCIHDGALLADPGRVRRYSRQQYLRTPAGDGGAVCRHPRGARELGGDRAPLQPDAEARRGAPAAVPGARRGVTTEQFLRAEAARGLDAALRQAGARAEPRGHRARLASELDVICQMGFAGYFLIVADFIRWAREQRGAGGSGARLGCRLARRLQPGHHRPRPASVRPAVRALPESRARLDARLRHRLLHGRARSGHRLRGATSTAASASRRSSPTAPWPPRRWCATSGACSA